MVSKFPTFLRNGLLALRQNCGLAAHLSQVPNDFFISIDKAIQGIR